jgi:hypothetical protein
VTRILDRWGTAMAGLRGEELRDAIAAAEGRTVLAELVAGAAPLLAGTANAELAAAFGADLVGLNMVDPLSEGVLVPGLEALTPPPDGFDGLAGLLGRPVGLNLEPDLDGVPAPFRVTAERAAAAAERGAAFVLVTANPGRGARMSDLADAVGVLREAAPQLLCVAGKMHQAGAEDRIDAQAGLALVDAGAQGVLVPLPGTMPGMSEATAAAMVEAVRTRGALTVGTIGTSQEGADPGTLRALALTAKRVGVDVHHIGDAGWTGLAPPDNLYAYSVAVRGVRHTWNRMARSGRAQWT